MAGFMRLAFAACGIPQLYQPGRPLVVQSAYASEPYRMPCAPMAGKKAPERAESGGKAFDEGMRNVDWKGKGVRCCPESNG